MNDTPAIQMPRYECHKKVWALKISAAQKLSDETWRIEFENPNAAPRTMDKTWSSRAHITDQDRGYLVVYEGGYESWSPTKPFEAGYVLIRGDSPE